MRPRDGPSRLVAVPAGGVGEGGALVPAGRGVRVLPTARGTGVAPRALATLTAWALDEAGFHRLELAHSVRNVASCRVATKSGFALEGTRRSAHLQMDGRHDMHLHARVQGDA
ncbi:hypothetical protein GCM10010211_81770 [Streptomyces albospinus]|uniref:N-acetyltransferase domain-containing protein n=1 Tax=Streptomyces albospinus TaxID=285515 RepID=A0ABQ2VQW3_9ACTN|nr:hypothetical protein GCM10010211_81770 [Streptomyces albospinus]